MGGATRVLQHGGRIGNNLKLCQTQPKLNSNSRSTQLYDDATLLWTKGIVLTLVRKTSRVPFNTHS